MDQAHLDHAQRELRTLVRSGFAGMPVMHGCEVTGLVYLRWWSHEWLDLLTVYGPQDAVGHRISGADPYGADLLRAARLRWILRADAMTAAQELRQLAPPTATSVRIKMRPADRHVAALQARGLVPDPQRTLAPAGDRTVPAATPVRD